MRLKLVCVVRKPWTSFSAAGGSGTCRTPAQAEGRRARPARYWNNCCSRYRRSFYSGAVTHTKMDDSVEHYIIKSTNCNDEGAYLSACNGEFL